MQDFSRLRLSAGSHFCQSVTHDATFRDPARRQGSWIVLSECRPPRSAGSMVPAYARGIALSSAKVFAPGRTSRACKDARERNAIGRLAGTVNARMIIRRGIDVATLVSNGNFDLFTPTGVRLVEV